MKPDRFVGEMLVSVVKRSTSPRGRLLGRPIDTFDLLLDLVVKVDLSGYRWKDEDEYAQGWRLGPIDGVLRQCVGTAREQVVSLIESRQGPFAEDWLSWRRGPAWSAPVLSAGMSTKSTADAADRSPQHEAHRLNALSEPAVLLSGILVASAVSYNARPLGERVGDPPMWLPAL